MNPTTAPATTPAAAGNFNTSSLYVGDLNSDVTETMLFEMFKSVGPVASLRVCRDAVSRRSLGYAYVNFHTAQDAERALDTLNYAPIRGRPCRIMWSHRDPSLRRSGAGNIFIKNLDKSIDHKALYDTFSVFGNILSCKVAVDEQGQSRGYGFVHYETAEAAQLAIAKVNNMLLKDKQVFVGLFQSRRERMAADPAARARFTNVFVKNLDPALKSDSLKGLFERFGTINSAVVMTGQDNASKGFGFVNFETPEAARAAVEEMNGQMVDSKVVFVGRAQKKSEREAELRARFEQLKQERLAKEAGVNLYVKNLDEQVDDAKLRHEFAGFGQITSCKVMRDEKTKVSKGFGFVSFAAPEEATKAIAELNGKMLLGKPLYVALAQRKEVRRAQLESFHRAQQNLARAGFPAGPLYAPGAGAPQAVFYPPGGRQQGIPGGPPLMAPYGQAGAPMGRPGRWGQQRMPMGPGGAPAPGAPPAGGAYPPGGYPAQGGPGGPRRGGPGGPRGARGGPTGGRPPAQPAPAAAAGPAAANPEARGFKWTPDARNKEAPAPAPAQGAAAPAENAASGADAQDERKLMLGEQLFPLVYAAQPKEAGKITGMLLESMSVQELLELLESPPALAQRIQEALHVLLQHTA